MNNTNHKTMLSDHFALEEFTYSRIAVENALDNTPPAEAKSALQCLVNCLLEPLRQLYKAPIAILSGYRSEAVNRLAGGVPASQHRKGEAADCYIAEGPEMLLSLLKRSGLPFDQAILYKRRRFLHLSLKQFGRNRMQVLVYMVCVVCLFSGCGLRRNTKQSENYSYEDSAYLICNDSVLLQKYSVLRDSLSWEIKKIEYLPPDSSGRQPLRSVVIARLLHSGSRADSLTTQTSSQQSYTTHMKEQVYKQKDHSTISYGVIVGLIVGVCILITGIIYIRRYR
nr:D-Ala-D-Ala carboxypeptidase family metallohydrolase [Parabacteroides goldsteinii]